MKIKVLLILVSSLIPTLAGAISNYDPITCPTDLSTLLLKYSGDNCEPSMIQTKCFYHSITDFRVQGCPSTGCQTNCTWEEFKEANWSSSLGGCVCSSSVTVLPECYTNSNGEYTCASGCYGVAHYSGSSISGCTKCPANASCRGGNSSFICDAGYYKSGNFCLPCPENAYCSNGSITCNPGSYKDGIFCVPCPEAPDPSPADSGRKPLGTTTSGATDITACYLYSGYPFTGGTGSYKFTENCYY